MSKIYNTRLRSAKDLLDYMNVQYSKLHTDFEVAFWDSNMGDHTADEKMQKAQVRRDDFRASVDLGKKVRDEIKKSKGEIRRRLKIWDHFFGLYQTPPQAFEIKKKASELEAEVLKIRTIRKEGYIDPESGAFVEASENRMRVLLRTSPVESVRKACFDALEKLPFDTIDKYIEIIGLRNTFARALGFDDFYAYKAKIDEDMTKQEIFAIFDKIYEKTKYAFQNVRKLEKDFERKGKLGLRKPWNFAYFLTGDFTKEEDPYFQFDEVLSYWGRSFSAMGIDYKGGTLKLDLLDRKGKYNNGFCHYPKLVGYKNGKIVAGSSGFTSNAVMGQIGAGVQGIHTVFHEAGHAADRLNSIQEDVCINHEYPPNTVSWAETHSMFMDTISSSIEWRTRYARDKDGNRYPFDIFERKLKAVHPIRPLEMMHVNYVVDFERQIYECANLSRDLVIKIAKAVYKKYFDRSEDSISILNVPHIYSWESSAYYHGYGMADLAVSQWRKYFFKKYGYIVDNPKVGKELQKIWSYASLHPAKKLVRMATGKPLGPEAFLRDVTAPLDTILKSAKKKIAKLENIPLFSGKITLNAKIQMMHGKLVVADNSKSFEDMDAKFRKWLKGQ
ncbi:MAG: M3 family metallopeptidase [Candidatus Taylorbacteria bacterium]